MNKVFYKSKRFWGFAALAIPSVGPALSAAIFALPERGNGIAEAITSAPPLTGNADLDILIQAFGVLLTLFGQYKATGNLTLRKER